MMNRFFVLLFAASCLTAVGQVPDHWPADGLIYWFDFESDGSSPGFDYEITTGAVNAAEDRFDLLGAAQFENDGDVLIATGDSQTPSGTFSYSFWFYTSPGSPTTTALHPIHGQTFGDEEVHSGSGVFVGSSQLAIVEHSAGYVREAIRVDMDLSGWHHVVVSYANNEATLYIDGEQHGESISDGRVVHPPLGACNYYGSWGIGEGYGNPSGQYDVTVQWTDYRFLGRLDDFGVWERDLLQEEVVTLFNASSHIGGCTNFEACNYNESALWDDGSCHFLCEYCIDGTIWNEELQGCVHGQSADINNDGCVQLNDLLDLLSAYGDCGAEESAWQCGDPLEYQGYDYETVLIGEQCWFAENARYLPQVSPSASWGASEVNCYVYGYNGSDVSEAASHPNYALHGVLYSYPALGEFGVCPSGWSIPSLADFESLAVLDDSGDALKSSAWGGTNDTGFNGLPSGISDAGQFHGLDWYTRWWTTDVHDGSRHMYFGLYDSGDVLDSFHFWNYAGLSVRCLKNAE